MDPKRILIIDKDRDSLELLSTRLETRGYLVSVAETSQDAFKKALDDVPDLILLDSQMEKIGSEEVAAVIKKSMCNFFVPIIMMSPRDKISEHIMGMHKGFDDFLTKPCSPLEVQLRVAMNLKRARETVQASPLTRLPGNIAIMHAMQNKIDSGERFAVVYTDIDNFKSFNDKYGFEKGDDVIIQTSRIMLRAAQELDTKDVFVGHIGGDDFVIILPTDYDEPFALKVIREFDRLIPTHYDETDQQRGAILIKNRRGFEETFPLMSLSIASVTNLHREFANTGHIAQTAAEVKKYLKTKEGSNFMRDRRTQNDELPREADVYVKTRVAEQSSEPLGQILLRAGLITTEQLSDALKKHFSTGQRLGRVLIQMKALSSKKVGLMLEQKLGVPYVSLSDHAVSPNILRTFTAEYVRSHGVVPMRVDGDTLHVAMIDPFDLQTVDNIERITGYQVAPYITLEEEFAGFVEAHYGAE